MPSVKSNRKILVKAAMLIALTIAGISFYINQQRADADSPTAKAPQAMPVIANIVKAAPIQLWKEFSARMTAVDFAEIRPQVSGKITEIRFSDGENVNQGDILFVIDPRPYQATVKQAKAELDAAENDAKHTQREFQRAKGLIKTQSISARIYDERENAAIIAKTSVEAAKARLIRAQIDVDHAFVKAPITGRISRAEITMGNVVESGPNAPVLTSIVSSNGIYADFDVDEQTYLTNIRSVAKSQKSEKEIPVKLSLGRGKYLYEGFIHSFDNRIDTASGTIRARAYFSNNDSALLPGMFGQLQLGSAIKQKQILVDEKAIGTNQDRKFVYIVDRKNKVAYREVTLGENLEGKRIITKGLKDGDTVITEGLIRIRPGMLVKPDTVQSDNINVTQAQ